MTIETIMATIVRMKGLAFRTTTLTTEEINQNKLKTSLRRVQIAATNSSPHVAAQAVALHAFAACMT